MCVILWFLDIMSWNASLHVLMKEKILWRKTRICNFFRKYHGSVCHCQKSTAKKYDKLLPRKSCCCRLLRRYILCDAQLVHVSLTKVDSRTGKYSICSSRRSQICVCVCVCVCVCAFFFFFFFFFITITFLCNLMLSFMALWIAFFGWIFVTFSFILGANKDCCCSVESFQWGGSNEHRQSMLWAKIRKISYTLANPTFSYIKLG